MLREALLLAHAEPACPAADIGRVGENDVEPPAGIEGPEVRLDDLDAGLEPVEGDVPPGQVGQTRLDLDGRDVARTA